MADQALACLDAMDFERKSFVVKKIQENGTMLQDMEEMGQQMIRLGSIIDQQLGNHETSQAVTAQVQAVLARHGAQVPQGEPIDLGSSLDPMGEAKNTKEARQRVAESTAPN